MGSESESKPKPSEKVKQNVILKATQCLLSLVVLGVTAFHLPELQGVVFHAGVLLCVHMLITALVCVGAVLSIVTKHHDTFSVGQWLYMEWIRSLSCALLYPVGAGLAALISPFRADKAPYWLVGAALCVVAFVLAMVEAFYFTSMRVNLRLPRPRPIDDSENEIQCEESSHRETITLGPISDMIREFGGTTRPRNANKGGPERVPILDRAARPRKANQSGPERMPILDPLEPIPASPPGSRNK